MGGAVGWLVYAASPKTYAAACYIYEPLDTVVVECSLSAPESAFRKSTPRWFARRIARGVDGVASALGITNIALEERLDN